MAWLMWAYMAYGVADTWGRPCHEVQPDLDPSFPWAKVHISCFELFADLILH